MGLWYRFIRGTTRLAFSGLCGFTSEGAESVPASGGVLLVSNHISFLDPPMVSCGMRRETYFLARKTLFKKNGFGRLISSLKALPIDQDRPDMNGLRQIIKLLKAGEPVLLFPEGARSWDGTIQKGEAGAGLVACKAAVPILPVRLFGSYEAYPRGGKFKRHPLRVVYGKPFVLPFAELSKRGKEGYDEASQMIMAKIAELR